MNENTILKQLSEYIKYMRSLGFKLTHEEKALENFAQYTLERNYDGPLTNAIVLEWISTGGRSVKTMGRKIEVIRPFSKYVAAIDENAEVVSNRFFKNVHNRPTPYIYTEEEVVKLMDKCKNLYSPDGIRAKTVSTVIGLLWSTGMRPSEPVNLRISDVDFQNNVIHIRESKFTKERYIPIDDSVSDKLYEYKNFIGKTVGEQAPEAAFFYMTGGKPLTKRALAHAFMLIRPCINAHPTGYPAVRLYDFRHTMACNTIRRWSELGMDVNSYLYILSTYLGHVKPQDTYWYLSATPEMLELSCSRL